MKYINKFNFYIKESKNIDIDEIKTILLSIGDMGIDTSNITEGVIVCSDKSDDNNGRDFISINMNLSDFDVTNAILGGVEKVYINDDLIWEFMDELISIKNKVIGVGVHNCIIDFHNNGGGWVVFNLIVIGQKRDIESNEYKILELYKKIKSIIFPMKTDFAYDTIVKLEDNIIKISTNSWSYTDRKFNNILRNALVSCGLTGKDIEVSKSQKSGIGTINKIEMK